ncbi:unnamed protein product [Danaus chrysippus]|uniref:(African queen) hypothetical protein n=1 Tax=Danaus chrysippus TaxID=151541 RepID=A0A8J2QRY5_9NEOP|nr:unnamed protein product [Danaus chrysippus]
MKTPYFTLSNTNDRIKGRVLKIMEMPQFNDSTSKKHAKVILNTIDLSNLHSINSKISLQHPVQIGNVDDSSIYHTTISLYVILLLCTVTLTIVLILQKLRSRSVNKIDISPGRVQETYEGREIDPHLIRVDHSNISASLSNKVLQ